MPKNSFRPLKREHVLPWHSMMAKTAFLPNNLSGIQLWLRADAIPGLSNNSQITTWTDNGPNSFSASQAVDASKPLFITGAVNNKPIVRFDGSNDFMTGTIGNFSAASFFSILSVVKFDAGGSRAIFDCTDNGQTNRSYLLFKESGDMKFRCDTTVEAASYVNESDTTNYNIISACNNGTTFRQIWKNGVAQGQHTESVAPQPASAYIIGILHANIYPMNGDVAEIITYNRQITISEHNELLKYLSNKYNIAVTIS